MDLFPYGLDAAHPWFYSRIEKVIIRCLCDWEQRWTSRELLFEMDSLYLEALSHSVLTVSPNTSSQSPVGSSLSPVEPLSTTSIKYDGEELTAEQVLMQKRKSSTMTMRTSIRARADQDRQGASEPTTSATSSEPIIPGPLQAAPLYFSTPMPVLPPGSLIHLPTSFTPTRAMLPLFSRAEGTGPRPGNNRLGAPGTPGGLSIQVVSGEESGSDLQRT